jgi:hypothetical protein
MINRTWPFRVQRCSELGNSTLAAFDASIESRRAARRAVR